MFYNFNPNLEGVLSYVHPLQVKAIQTLLGRNIPHFIEYIILFGSSVESSCHSQSDLDLYVIYSEDCDYDCVLTNTRKLFKGLGRPVDVLYSTFSEYNEMKDSLNSVERESYEKGVVIYAQ